MGDPGAAFDLAVECIAGIGGALLRIPFVGAGSNMVDALKEHGGIQEEFGNFRETIFKSVGEKKVDDFFVMCSLALSVQCLI